MKCEPSSTHSGGEVTAILTAGIDLAKNVFALHSVNETGKPESQDGVLVEAEAVRRQRRLLRGFLLRR